MINLCRAQWEEYELIDSGNFEKLERFGDYILIRPEPQALWQPKFSCKEWILQADAHFTREHKDNARTDEEPKGGWKKLKSMPESWTVNYKIEHQNFVFRLALTGFGHVGIFPEQGNNWEFIWRHLKKNKDGNVLNLFAYTGAASLVARQAGAQVTHVDASRPGLNWANQNRQLNRLDNIRWVHEDVIKFVRREVKRQRRYSGIIMDPPPYGRGPEGEKWVLQDTLDELVALSRQLLAENSFLVLSMYAAGLSAVTGFNVVKHHFPDKKLEYGEFYLPGAHKTHLPMGTFVRFG